MSITLNSSSENPLVEGAKQGAMEGVDRGLAGLDARRVRFHDLSAVRASAPRRYVLRRTDSDFLQFSSM
jgi:hypothetical protein